MKRRIFAIVAAIAVVAVGLVASPTVSVTSVQAADARDFNAGNIISDQLFFDGGALSAGQIQSFLNVQVPTCRAGYKCLKDFTQSTPSRAAVSGRCDAYSGATNERASSIIAKVGAACGISQKVLLVMLEKEQSLVGDTWPSDQQYRAAMGYGCPDTSDCDANYYGFFNQVYAAALQFKNYAANPGRWNHIAGRVNTVRYNPNAACGSSQVFIQNQATAGLYNYTPYQPNASALANLYGSGDGCGAYGNRNFWRLYTDWYGSTTGASNLLRTLDNASVYLVSGDKKYPVTSMAMVSALAPLGQVGYVSQSYLDRYTTAQAVGRIMRSPNGTIFFFDAAIKLPFGSCGLVVDYGGSCDSTGYVQLTDTQVAAFVTGPAMTRVLGTTEGGRYAITAGTKREILDTRSQNEAGYAGGYNVLTEAGIAQLPLGTPIARDSAFVLQRGSNSFSFLSGGSRFGSDAGTSQDLGLTPAGVGTLSANSLAKIPAAPSPFTGVVRAPGTTTSQLLSSSGRYEWLGDPDGSILPAVAASQEFVNGYSVLGSVNQGSFVKSGQTSTVYVIAGASVRPVGSWAALVALSGGGSPSIATVPQAVIGKFSTGGTVLAPTSLVRSPSNGTIYLVDGLSSKIAMSSFDPATELGVTGYSTVSDQSLAAYASAAGVLGYGVTCGGQNFVSAGGKIHAVSAALAAAYPISYTALSDVSCSILVKGADATSFIRTANGSIYKLENGAKRPISSIDTWIAIGGPAEGYLDVSQGFAAQFPTGAPL
ncbi:hypothetical protein [Plantibacter sp. YIM 135249]|uniref:hypothetical protein n=1 Tax=Plantibacter sp. YIM 135249 TaxID=3423918 RepID=UPI003D335A0E